MRKTTTAHLEKAFRERILGHFGASRTFVCDDGIQCTSRSFKAFYKRVGMQIEHTIFFLAEFNGVGQQDNKNHDCPIHRRPTAHMGYPTPGDLVGNQQQRLGRDSRRLFGSRTGTPTIIRGHYSQRRTRRSRYHQSGITIGTTVPGGPRKRTASIGRGKSPI